MQAGQQSGGRGYFLAIFGNAAIGNHPLHFAPRCHTGTRQQFGNAIAFFGRTIGIASIVSGITRICERIKWGIRLFGHNAHIAICGQSDSAKRGKARYNAGARIYVLRHILQRKCNR